MFGGKYPNLKVFQVFVCPCYRAKGIASQLINELACYGEEHSYLSMSARVADDLPANDFWAKSGFELIRKQQGGKTTKRIINIRSRELESPSLLKLMRNEVVFCTESLCYKDRPTISNPVYAIDINILLDVVRGRNFRKEASAVLRAGFNNRIRLCVTNEFVVELERNSKNLDNDPLLELAKELPVLTNSEVNIDKELISDLRKLVFPNRSEKGKKSIQDNSDLIHLALAIHRQVDGFITREAAILRAKDHLYYKYNLDILSPIDFYDSAEFEDKSTESIVAVSQSSLIYISEPSINDKKAIENFLLKEGVEKGAASRLLKFDVTGASLKRLCIKSNDRVIGFAAWDAPVNLTPDTTLYFFIDESDPGAEHAIDHVFETVYRDGPPQRLRRITLKTGKWNEFVKDTGILRGFRSLGNGSNDLLKLAWTGIINSENWKEFRKEFCKVSGLELSLAFPDQADVHEEAIEISDDKNRKKWKLSIFDFETLLSPGLIVNGVRDGLIIPITPTYASELGITKPSQLPLLAQKEAYLHIEKAYFRKNSGQANYRKGMIAVFYISGSSPESKACVGCARITHSGLYSVDDAINKFSRQGVLTKNKLVELEGADKNKRIHTFTFDNYNCFASVVDRKAMFEFGAISPANLVTAEKKTASIISPLLGLAFLKE